MNGDLEGLWKGYYENGELKYEEHYKGRLLDGHLKAYHENGQLERDATFALGIPMGNIKEWHDNGQLAGVFKYKGTTLIKAKCWNEDGRKIECE